MAVHCELWNEEMKTCYEVGERWPLFVGSFGQNSMKLHLTKSRHPEKYKKREHTCTVA